MCSLAVAELDPRVAELLAKRAEEFDKAPVIHLRQTLASHRARGVDFEQAWPDAVSNAVFTVPKKERPAWLAVFAETRDAWRRAYVGEAQTAAEAALVVLASLLSGTPDPPDPRTLEGHCDWCGKRIDRADYRARYCSTRCRRDAAYAREKERALSHKSEGRSRGPVRVLPNGARRSAATTTTRPRIAA